MPWGVAAAAVATVGTVLGAGEQAQGAQNAANTQANAALAQQGNLLAAGQGAAQQFAPYANYGCLLYTSPSPRDGLLSRMPSSA